MLSAIIETIYNYLGINLTGKNIDPFNNCKCDKMNSLLIPDFISSDWHISNLRQKEDG